MTTVLRLCQPTHHQFTNIEGISCRSSADISGSSPENTNESLRSLQDQFINFIRRLIQRDQQLGRGVNI